jgi:hypothetical protein
VLRSGCGHTETRVVGTRWDERSDRTGRCDPGEPVVLDGDTVAPAVPDATEANAPADPAPSRSTADAIRRINDVVAQITERAARDHA